MLVDQRHRVGGRRRLRGERRVRRRRDRGRAGRRKSRINITRCVRSRVRFTAPLTNSLTVVLRPVCRVPLERGGTGTKEVPTDDNTAVSSRRRPRITFARSEPTIWPTTHLLDIIRHVQRLWFVPDTTTDIHLWRVKSRRTDAVRRRRDEPQPEPRVRDAFAAVYEQPRTEDGVCAAVESDGGGRAVRRDGAESAQCQRGLVAIRAVVDAASIHAYIARDR